MSFKTVMRICASYLIFAAITCCAASLCVSYNCLCVVDEGGWGVWGWWWSLGGWVGGGAVLCVCSLCVCVCVCVCVNICQLQKQPTWCFSDRYFPHSKIGPLLITGAQD